MNHARPGDLVLISPGTYHESVTSPVADLDLRGLDRNTVILDGGDTLANGITVGADGDVVENLTVRHYAINGVLFTKAAYAGSTARAGAPASVLQGYRASYVTTYDNGLYGVYAFAARGGQIDHTYASGQPDSGIYIGQCSPCEALVTASVARGNRVGFEGANASGKLTVTDSTFTGNRAGLTIESSSEETMAPQHGALVAGNLVTSNDNPQTPTQNLSTDVFGYGIVIGGGSDDIVMVNRVTGNTAAGVLVSDLDGYHPARNIIRDNVVSTNGTDLAFTAGGGGVLSVAGTCFAGNTFATSLPAGIETTLPCGGGPPSVSVAALNQPASPAGVDYTTLPAPSPQATMADAASAPAVAALGLGQAPPVASITVPSG